MTDVSQSLWSAQPHITFVHRNNSHWNEDAFTEYCRQCTLHQKDTSEEQFMHTHTHTHTRQQKNPCTYPCTQAGKYTHGCTITCPTSSVSSTAQFTSLYLILHMHLCTRLYHKHTVSHRNILRHVNPAWKQERRNLICSNWTYSMATASRLQASWMRHTRHTDPMTEIILEQWPENKRRLAPLPSLALLMCPQLKKPRRCHWN